MSTQVKAIGTEAQGTPMHEMTIERRDLRPEDVAFEVLYCGICHSDLHSVHNDWGNAAYPLVPGHEIVGRVTSVGSAVTGFKPGDLAAVGCIVDSCRHCEHCQEGEEQYCDSGVTFSFNSPDTISGGMTYGGFSKTYVCDEKYVLKMPPFNDLAASAPLLCAGITVYSPLKHWNAGPGKRIGILGIGGLGHVAIKIAKALGAEVTVFTTSPSKVADALEMGADRAVVSSDTEQMKNCPKQDMILDTVSAKHNVNTYLHLLKVDGALVLVGLPAEPLEVASFMVVNGRKSFSGSNIGGIRETQEMLDFCFKNNITADIELIKPDEVNEAFERLGRNDVKYRFVIDMDGLKN
ncbi:MAG: NAD(P)-dependent alcohol dehydrogenase [Capnocytophaga sp.]|nr:NAD(P)-dependent alcohol dehydrogenase [Capnocytophaga sp.]